MPNPNQETTELPASHQAHLPTNRIKKLARTLASIDTQLRTRRAALSEQSRMIHALLKTRDGIASELYPEPKQDD